MVRMKEIGMPSSARKLKKPEDFGSESDDEDIDEDLDEDELSNYSDDEVDEDDDEEEDEVSYEEENESEIDGNRSRKRRRESKEKSDSVPYFDLDEDEISDDSDEEGNSGHDLQKFLTKSEKGIIRNGSGDAWVDEEDDQGENYEYFREGQRDETNDDMDDDEDKEWEDDDEIDLKDRVLSQSYEASRGDNAFEAIRAAKRKKKRYGKKLTPRIDVLLGKANKAIMTDQRGEAMKLLREVVLVAPHAIDAYRSLAAVAGSRGDKRLELELNMCICGINKQDAQQIKDTLQLAQLYGDSEKQLECLRRLNCVVPNEINYIVDRAELLAKCNKPLMAASTYRAAIKRTPKRIELYFTMSDMCAESKVGQLQNMRIQLLAGLLAMLLGRKYTRASVLGLANGWYVSETDEEARKSPDSVFSGAKLLSDLLMLPKKPYASVAADVLTGVDEWTVDFQEDIASEGGSLAAQKLAMMPIDLATKRGICLIHMGEMQEAMTCFRMLLQQDPSQEFAGSLMAQVTEAMMKKKYYKEAIPILGKLSTGESSRKWYGYVRMGEALTKIGQYEAANIALKEVLELFPGHCGALIAYSILHRAVMSELIAEAALGALRGPIMRLVCNELNIGEICPEFEEVPSDSEEMHGLPEKGIKMIIVNGYWQKLQILMEYAQLARAAGNEKDQLNILLPVLDHCLRQVRSAPIMVKLSKWSKAKVRNMKIDMVDGSDLPAFYIGCPWQTEEQRSIADATNKIAAEVDLQRLMGAKMITNLVREVVRGLVSIKRRKDASALVRAVNRISGLPMTPEYREHLNIICAYGRRVLGWNRNPEKISLKKRISNVNDSDFSDGKRGSDSDHEHEWDNVYEFTERSSQMEQYLGKVAAIKRDPTNTVLWNDIVEDVLQHKTSTRRRLDALIEIFPKAAMPWLIQGNTMNASARLKHTLHCFSTAIAREPDESLPYLCLGNCLIRLVLNVKRTPDFHECAVKAISALHKYAELRLKEEKCENEALTEDDPPTLGSRSREVSYNLARAYHQLGVMHMAEQLYWNAMKPDNKDSACPGATAITRVAAYNLSKLYQDAGSIDMARHVLNEYIAIY